MNSQSPAPHSNDDCAPTQKQIFCAKKHSWSNLAVITSVILGTAFSNVAAAKTVSVTSPDKQIVISIVDDSGQPEYKVEFHGKEVITSSRLGLVFQSLGEFGKGFEIEQSKSSTTKNRWQQPWGEQEWIENNYNQLSTTLSNGKYKLKLHFKAFDDGIGFRYELPQQAGLDALTITNELTEFSIPQADKAQAWWIPARGWNRYEYLYTDTALDKITNVHTPFTFKLESGVHMSIHEAALVDYAAMTLNQRRSGKLKADLTPWSDGSLVKTQAGFFTPWRTIQISDAATGLLNSHLILNLNEPNKLGDVSWVEPGKYVGIWWGMHLNENTWGSGDKHGATTSETKRYMDFAANNGFDGVLVEGWNLGWDGSCSTMVTYSVLHSPTPILTLVR